MTEHLSNHHRQTLAHLLDHQHAGNIRWREVRSLVEAIGEVEEERNGKVRISIGDTTFKVHDPGHHEIDTQLLVDLRRALEAAGYGAQRGGV